MKLKMVLSFLLPMMSMAASLLRDKDSNSTGVDDEAAEAIEHTITRLNNYTKFAK